MAATFNFEKFSKAYATLNAQKAEIENKMKVLKSKLEEHVNTETDRKVQTKYTTMYFKKGYDKEVVDLKAIKAENPKLYESLMKKGYIKVSKVKESFTVDCKAVLVETTTTTVIK